jgi:hypothetical protein
MLRRIKSTARWVITGPSYKVDDMGQFVKIHSNLSAFPTPDYEM